MRPRVIERQAEVARSLAAARLAGFTDDECVDLMASFAEPVVAEFLRRVIGLDDVSDSALGEWFRGIGAGASNFEGATDKQAHADAVTAEIDEAVARALAPDRPVADGSLLDVLGPHGADVPFEFLTSTVKLFIIGGLQEPRDLIGLTLAGVLGTPEQFNLLSADPARLPAAIEEGARWGSPVGTVTRRVAEPVRLEDVTLPQGAIVAGVIAAANRDPRRWNDPDVFDLIRARRPHLAYGAGTHLCLGASAARILVRTALKELLSRWPRLRLVDEPEIRGYEFRGPVALNVQLH
jgi:hypothetical protein